MYVAKYDCFMYLVHIFNNFICSSFRPPLATQLDIAHTKIKHERNSVSIQLRIARESFEIVEADRVQFGFKWRKIKCGRH